MISNIDEIKAKADILSVVEHFLPLQKANGLYKCCCPFHEEKTPSFTLNTRHNYFYCFGCNEKGDVFSFVQKYKHLDFTEAVKEVARICNIELKEAGQALKRADYTELLENINSFLKSSLKEDEKALDELYKRGLEAEDINKFDIGFFKDLPALMKLLSKDDLKRACELGFISFNAKNNSYYSMFINRFTFALRDNAYKIIGFSSRKTSFLKCLNEEAKYYNSKESFLFKKSEFLYNLVNARQSILKEKEVIILEGFFDVFCARKYALSNCVATCGTALSLAHLSQLKKLSDDLTYILFFDKDNAGENANLKALKLFFKEGIFKLKVRVLKTRCKDLGDLLLKKEVNAENLKEYFHDYTGLEYYIKLNLLRANKNSHKENELFKEIKELVNSQNFFLRSELVKEAARHFKCEENLFNLNESLNKAKPVLSLEKSILKAVASDEKSLFLAKNYLHKSDFKECGADFDAFVNENVLSESLKMILLDENILKPDEKLFKECLKGLKKLSLEADLKKAKLSANLNLIVELKERMKGLA